MSQHLATCANGILEILIKDLRIIEDLIKVFWRFQGVQKWNIGLKWINDANESPIRL